MCYWTMGTGRIINRGVILKKTEYRGSTFLPNIAESTFSTEEIDQETFA
jgi:hypothetical protein